MEHAVGTEECQRNDTINLTVRGELGKNSEKMKLQNFFFFGEVLLERVIYKHIHTGERGRDRREKKRDLPSVRSLLK